MLRAAQPPATHVSAGGLADLERRGAEILMPWHEQISAEARNSAVLHADETGWRVTMTPAGGDAAQEQPVEPKRPRRHEPGGAHDYPPHPHLRGAGPSPTPSAFYASIGAPPALPSGSVIESG
ncbi:MAG: hypothetical protein EA376_13615 [Phycisphaeraceae bacterium]|nr:MAG: hypothetical protein EA376_13615 [Phycisphaeraceae bacterium]